MSKSRIYIPNDSEFKELVAKSASYSEILRKLGLSTTGGSSTRILKKRIQELGCSIKHFSITAGGRQQRYTIEEICVKNSTYQNRNYLKKRLINEKYLEYKCDVCGIQEWNNKKISLHLDHINGINNDHRLENLRLLCPNCHSQTETYAGKNSSSKIKKSSKKTTPISFCSNCGEENSKNSKSGLCITCYSKTKRVAERPSALQLAKEIIESSFVAVGKEHGVSDNAIRKWCKSYDIPYRKKELEKWYNKNKA